MTEKNNGGPAFPISNNDVITEVIKYGNHPEGMSLRDILRQEHRSHLNGGLKIMGKI